MIPLRALAFACLAGPCVANDLPALYSVSDVGKNDVLNIRSAPSAGSPTIGSLPSNAANVEVVETDATGRWGRINTGEGTGWIALRFATRQSGQDATNTTRCFGTEPFWSLDLGSDARLTRLNASVETRVIGSVQHLRAAGRSDRFGIVARSQEQGPVLTGVLRRELCSDGMSDRLYGLGVDLVIIEAGAVEQIAGCCTIAPNLPE